MLSLLKLFIYSIGLFDHKTYDIINDKHHTEYITFIEQNNKTYNYSKYITYANNLDYINDMNSKNLSYELEANHFIDQSNFMNMGNFGKKDHCHNCFIGTNNNIPHSIDWREKNVVTHIKNQGDCGSCWAFSATGSIEGINAIKYNKLHNVSEQELMDCSSQYGNKGCMGGLMDNAFKYVEDNNGLCSEKDYPYEGIDDVCLEKQCNNVVQIDDYSDVKQNNETILMRAVAQQPISVAIQANLTSFRFYKSGVYQDTECADLLDHGVLIVGYGTDIFQNLDYWIVKNSWGPEWGDNGYIKILRNYDKYGGNSSGMCGIALQPSLPIIY